MTIITDLKARNIKPDSGVQPHGGVVGLALHPSGTKGHGKWVLRYVSPVTGKRRNAGLGSYPSISIAEAAKLGLTMRAQIEDGQDPLEIKGTETKKPKIPTFQEASAILHAELSPSWKNKKHGQQWINTLSQFALPVIGDLALDLIQPRHIADVLRPIWLTKTETASRLKQRIHAVIAWGWAHGYCQSNPVDVVSHLLPQQTSKAIRTQHHPAIPWQRVPEFVAQHLPLW